MTGPVPRVAPSDIEAEQSVLGAIMIDNRVVFEIRALVDTADFFRADHQVIWTALMAMHDQRLPIDFVTASGFIRDRGELEACGGIAYLSTLSGETPSSANVAHYARRVREMARRRRLIAFAGDITQQAYGGEESEILTQQVAAAATDLLRSSTAKSRRFAEVAIAAQDSAEVIRKARAEGRSLGAMSGIRKLDQITGGFSGPKLIVIAARPKCCKSALLNQFGIYAASHHSPGYINTIELQDQDLALRGMAMLSGQNVTQLHRGNQKAHDAAADAIARLGDIPLWLDDSTNTLEGFCAQVAYHRHRHGIHWAAVDHIGLMRTAKRFGNRNDQMGEISWSLKELAKTLGIPIIALSQLSRLCDKENRRPKPDDLRDSGNIEQDADMVIMLHTPQNQRDLDERPIWIGIPANRSGPSFWLSGPEDGVAPFRFLGPSQAFVDMVPLE